MSEYDDWEPDDDEQDTKPVGDKASPSSTPDISAEAVSILKQAKSLGLTETELLARATRDLERERAAADRGGRAAAQDQGGSDAGEDDDGTITKGEMKRIAAEARAQAVFDATSMANRTRLEGIIDSTINSAADFGPETPAGKVKTLHAAAWQRLANDAEIRNRGRQMSSGEVDRIMAKAVRDVLDEERQFAQRLLKAVDGRPAAKDAVDTGNPNAARKKRPVQTVEATAEYDWDEGYGVRAPTTEEIDAERRKALAAFARSA